jgi:lipoate-protein ligase B
MPLGSPSTFRKINDQNSRLFEMSEENNSTKTCVVYQLGLVEYGEAYRVQKKLHRQRLDGAISDTLLLLEHPPTVTIGRSGSLENVLVSKERLTQEGISLFFIGRGGDVTYHGPGQLVGYPIMGLSERGEDIHRYVHDLEEVLIQTLEDFSIYANRDNSHAGVWVGKEEVAAIGLSIRRWVTMHGFALNVNPNLTHFSFINPCGFSNRKATSMSQLLGREVHMEAVARRLVAHFSDVFGTSIEVSLSKAELYAMVKG